ncbi:unnamed protein product [Schistocephalus solidus]|uniref:Uncharacterized protein n=1 Tax=Schistocephalus solidus TaxID=70667 RepID=A0A183SKU0_SCHSO|nr:unnamed protein product [Schistocephalus solidus]
MPVLKTNLEVPTQSGAILALLDDEVYEFTRSANISVASTTSVVLSGLHEILGSSENPWVLQSDFERCDQQPGIQSMTSSWPLDFSVGGLSPT